MHVCTRMCRTKHVPGLYIALHLARYLHGSSQSVRFCFRHTSLFSMTC